jgi:hypothetical protein
MERLRLVGNGEFSVHRGAIGGVLWLAFAGACLAALCCSPPLHEMPSLPDVPAPRVSWRNGFTVRHIDSDAVIVQYNGPEGLQKADVEARLLFRCAELALESGRDAFVVESLETTVAAVAYNAETEATASSSAWFVGRTGVLSTGHASGQASGESQTSRYTGFARIRIGCRSDFAASAGPYSAETTYNRLTPFLPEATDPGGLPATICKAPPCRAACRQTAEKCTADCRDAAEGGAPPMAVEGCLSGCRSEYLRCGSDCPDASASE